jgi:hypothetical protein
LNQYTYQIKGAKEMNNLKLILLNFHFPHLVNGSSV